MTALGSMFKNPVAGLKMRVPRRGRFHCGEAHTDVFAQNPEVARTWGLGYHRSTFENISKNVSIMSNESLRFYQTQDA